MRLLAATGFVLAILAAPAGAQLDPDPDGIGIYADTSAMTVNVSADPGTIFPVYLIATRASTQTGINTWACRVVVPENAEILGWNVPGFSSNVAQPPEFVVARGNDSHLPASAVVLMTFYVRMSTSDEAYFYLEGAPLAGQGFDQAPVYLEAGDFNTPHFMHSFPSGAGQPVFAVNGMALAVEPSTWGGVKALYR